MKALVVLLLLVASPAYALDLINPYFHKECACADPPRVYGPEAPHPIATDCAVSDSACVDEYNSRVLTMALMLTDASICARSTQPDVCHDVYTVTFDERIELPAITECSWIYQLRGGQAVLLMPLTGRVARVIARPGWTPRTYVGNCSALPKGFSVQTATKPRERP